MIGRLMTWIRDPARRRRERLISLFEQYGTLSYALGTLKGPGLLDEEAYERMMVSLDTRDGIMEKFLEEVDR